ITVVELVALAEIFGLPTESLIPKTRIVEQHLRDWAIRHADLEIDKIHAEAELAEIKDELAGAKALENAFRALQNYQATGDESEVADALDTIAMYAESCTDMTPTKLRIDVVAVLEDLSIHPALIEEAIKVADRADGGNQPTKLVRHVTVNTPFKPGRTGITHD
ncbi:hypothetical protein, partial [Rhodococcus sp. UNC363MFTsu5.1]|uniref:hypothetical protein n=1 Tax=Rhodococcus sp. UNC363MFTsu5.1 TaxID=1449069 RepID=UPI00056AC3DF